MRFKHQAISAACLATLCSGSAQAGIEGLQRVASGLSSPIFAATAPGDPSRMFIAQRGGAIRVLNLNTGVLEATPFLSIPGVDTEGEGGLLGLAFHPNYSNAGSVGFGKFYVNLTTDGAPLTTRIREYSVTANPNVASLASQVEMLSIAQPQSNHNGGWIGFSPIDNYLYIATGDGGGSNDSGSGHTAGTGNAQDITSNLLGKILRLDVNGDDFPTDNARNYAIPPSNPFVGETGDDEIWSYGLRNPFRASFDRQTGDLWIGDVGQGSREEINFQPASSTGGENYGWRLREGLIATPGVGGDRPPGNVDPVYDYNRDADEFGGTIVTGGYVYRGSDPSLVGKYFFLDSRNSASTADDNYWIFDPVNPFGTVQNVDSLMIPDVGLRQFPVSFGEDALGNLYIVYLVSGEVYRIRTTTAPGGTWNINTDGNWSSGANWLGGSVPNAVGDTADFHAVITAPRTVTVDSPRTVGVINFNSPVAYTLAGANVITMDVATGQAAINVLQGSHTISAPIVLNVDLTINVASAGSTLSLTGELTAAERTVTKSGAGVIELENLRAAALSVSAGITRISPKITANDPSGTSVVQSLSIATDAQLDLTNNSTIIDYADSVGTLVDDTRQHLLERRLISTSTTPATALGYGDNAVLSRTTFAGQSVDADSLLIMYTYFGDSDLDGDVDVADLGNLASAWQTSGVWTGGDFDYSGFVDVADLGLLASNWQAGVDSPLGPQAFADALAAMGLSNTSVPEPAMGLVGVFAMLGLRKRHRFVR